MEVTQNDIDKATKKIQKIDEKHLEQYKEFYNNSNLEFSFEKIFACGVWSPDLEKYRKAFKKQIEARKLKTIQERQKYDNPYQNASFEDFIEENQEETEEETEEETADFLGNAQEKAFFDEKNNNQEIDPEELEEQREDFSQFFTLVFDSGLKEGIKWLTKYKFEKTKHTDKRVSSLEKTTLKIMKKYNYVPSFWEELGVHFTFYGMDLIKGLKLKEETDKKEINYNAIDEIQEKTNKQTDKRTKQKLKEQTKEFKKQEEPKKQEPSKTNKKVNNVLSIVNG